MDQHVLRQVHDWMFHSTLPVWIERAIDRNHGGPVECFAFDGSSCAGLSFKRSRVCSRQIYVMSHAHMLGVEGALPVAQELMDFFVERMWLGPDRGWVRRLTLEGGILDPTPDLYDHAFALFALGWFYKATGDRSALSLAHQTLDFVERAFPHPGGEGFHHVFPAALPRQQNPHMHLFEAALVLAGATDDPRFSALADDLVRLFRTRLCQLPDGVLPEFFGDDWTPVQEMSGRRVEPGHQFEWAWMLAQHQQMAGQDHVEIVRALVDWAERRGVDAETQTVFNCVSYDGTPIDRSSRTWPNTERIKGWLALFELTGRAPWKAVESSVRMLMSNHLGPGAPPGMWIDAFDPDGAPIAPNVPASTLYHVFLAFSEVLRVAPVQREEGATASEQALRRA